MNQLLFRQFQAHPFHTTLHHNDDTQICQYSSPETCQLLHRMFCLILDFEQTLQVYSIIGLEFDCHVYWHQFNSDSQECHHLLYPPSTILIAVHSQYMLHDHFASFLVSFGVLLLVFDFQFRACFLQVAVVIYAILIVVIVYLFLLVILLFLVVWPSNRP